MAAALALYPGARESDAVLARFVVREMEPPLDPLVWAVSLDPETATVETYGIAGNSPPGWSPGKPRVVYAVSFVDAKTGEELRNVSQTLIPYASPKP